MEESAHLTLPNSDLEINVDDGELFTNVTAPQPEKEQPKKLPKLPLTRVKTIMKLDPENGKISQDSVVLVTKAAELFLQYLGREAAKYAMQSKRKTVQRRDINTVIDSVPQLCFLEGALD
uniref:Transcription factor CBF/NF-Y/archaeal histone domain-containing protein n=1 Tax=Photinus pyralis TaxID=7054 RepID=A0A1Y1LJ31_PHOPY